MRIGKLLCLLALVMMPGPPMVYAQEQPPKKDVQEDVFDVFRSKKKKEKLQSDTITVRPYKLYISAFPVVGYNPALGFLIGATFNPAIFFGNPKNTPISAFATNLQVTSKHQLLISLRSVIFTNKANYIFSGDWRFYIFNQPTYGLGSNIRGVDSTSWIMPNGDAASEAGSAAEPMDYNFIRFYETINKRIAGRFFIGVGYSLDYHWNIRDEKLSLDSGKVFLTQHYIYSVNNGFNPETYTNSGISLSFLYDSRDNSCRPTKGIYAALVPKFNASWLGSSKTSITMYTEFRTYIGLSKRNPAHLLAFWYNGGFLLYGKLPYLDLPAIGWDKYGRTGRGYVQGRIRGVDYMYGEVEYRFPISPHTRVLSGVLFCNAITCDNDDKTQKMFQYIAPAAGFGVRVMINKRSLSNLTVDLGFGLNGSRGVFLNINEVF